MSPYSVDKIIIDKGQDKGDAAITNGYITALEHEYEGAQVLAEEMNEHGWLQDADALDFLARQEAICQRSAQKNAAYHEWLREHLKAQRELVHDMRLTIDKKLRKPATP